MKQAENVAMSPDSGMPTATEFILRVRKLVAHVMKTIEPLAPSDGPTSIGIGAILTYPVLLSTKRRRNMLSAQCTAALNRRQILAIGQAREKSKTELPIVSFRSGLQIGSGGGLCWLIV